MQAGDGREPAVGRSGCSSVLPLKVLRARRGSVPAAADRRAGLVELVADLAAHEDDRGDDREGDQRDEEDVLHQVRALLVVPELRLEPGLQYEEVHGAPFRVRVLAHPDS